ncbi:DsbA family protein [Desulfofustis glycolicus]|uniref:Protein-disulfide isomerase n=1 Tax=Desulfofustis glycolicus DSM 9705 TaxID=1121409 RepID=A0A1M5YIG4_9BACT|nr:thioredoxin domain-containing protein [Desulfofustis glycolicus]MCB2214791.1 thioredoxin domain-containing protein [Desulfobulbaceae bacterium]SHI11669.1 Protein-disulfide isomerase [Desulfofustis glycolicus DSM 9705]
MIPFSFFRAVAVGSLLLLPTISSAAAQSAPTGLIFEQTSQWQLPQKPLDLVQSVDGKYLFVLTDQQSVLIYETNGQFKGSVPVDKGVSAIDTDARGENILLINNKDNTFSSIAIDFVVDIDVDGSPTKGNPEAPVTLTVFTDFECPYCKQFAPMLDEVHELNKDTTRIVFKNMPLRFHNFADPAARAALAAGAQGKFWEMHDILFAVPELNDQAIVDAATKLGLDMARFNQDMNSPAVRQQINKDLQAAQEAGVTGTPTIFVNGKRVKNRSMEGFQAMIDQELQGGGQ